MGFKNVSTYIASGNIIFESRKSDLSKLEIKIEKHLHKSLGYEVDTFVRTREQLEKITKHPTFPKNQLELPKNTLHLILLKSIPTKEDHSIFKSLKTPTDTFAFNNCELYWLCGTGVSESDVWKSKMHKQLSWHTSTMRKFNTVIKIIEKIKV